MFHVSVPGKLCPPDLHDTIPAAEEFFLVNFPEESGCIIESVRPLRMSDLFSEESLTSVFREAAAQLINDDSLMDSQLYSDHVGPLVEELHRAMNDWGDHFGISPNGNKVLSATIFWRDAR